jgi:hypothetical protein
MNVLVPWVSRATAVKVSWRRARRVEVARKEEGGGTVASFQRRMNVLVPSVSRGTAAN